MGKISGLLMAAMVAYGATAFAGGDEEVDVAPAAIGLPPPGMAAQIVNEEAPDPQDEAINPGEDGGDEGVQPVQKADQVMATLSDGKAITAKRRNAAEQKLVDLGPTIVEHLKAMMRTQKGVVRDILVVAVFRLENSSLSPREMISGWVSKQVDGDPAKVLLEHVAADELRRAFPNHLFYRAELPGAAGAKGTFPKTVVALAADGKVQAVGDDGSLAKFLKHELAEEGSVTERRRTLGAAAVLALARDLPNGAEVVSDGQIDGIKGTGTAWVAGKKGKKIAVTFTLTAEGGVTGVTSGAVENVATSEPGKQPERAGGGGPATGPRPGIRLPRPIMRGGPEPFVPPAAEDVDK